MGCWEEGIEYHDCNGMARNFEMSRGYEEGRGASDLLHYFHWVSD